MGMINGEIKAQRFDDDEFILNDGISQCMKQLRPFFNATQFIFNDPYIPLPSHLRDFLGYACVINWQRPHP